MNSSSQKKEYFDRVAHSRLKWRKKYAYYHEQLEKLLKFIIPSQKSVLDIGCSLGDRLSALEPSHGVGVDISQEMISMAKENHPKFHFVATDLKEIDIDGQFDYVVVSNVIGYMDNLQRFFEQLKNACRSETRVVLIYNNHLWKPLLKLAEIIGLRMKWPEQHWLSSADIENLCYLADFRVITKREFMLFPFRVPILATLLNKFIVHLPIIQHLAFNHVMVIQPKTKRFDPDHVTCSVLVPCRNEKGNIEAAIERTPKMGSETEFIFMEGHSQDGTFEECERVRDQYSDLPIKVFKQTGKGKVNAVREGFDVAEGDVLMILDADLTTPPEDMPKFFDALVSGKGEFINGSRLVYTMEKKAMRFLNMLANKFFGIALSYLIGQQVKDTLCGTKVMWKEDYKRLVEGRSYFGDFDPFGDFDLLFGAAKMNLKIIEVPVRYRDRVYGETQIRRFAHGWLLLKMVVFAMRKMKFI